MIISYIFHFFQQSRRKLLRCKILRPAAQYPSIKSESQEKIPEKSKVNHWNQETILKEKQSRMLLVVVVGK